MKNRRFKVIYSQDERVYTIRILEDTETGKQYLMVSEVLVSGGVNTSICLL